MSTETPRTNEAERTAPWPLSGQQGAWKFARTIERELTAAKAAIAAQNQEIERLTRRAEEYRDRALHLEHLEAVALRYRDLWLICHESNPRAAEEGEQIRLGHIRGLLFAAAARRELGEK